MFKHSWLSVFGSLLLATVVWVSVTLNNSYTARFTVPLRVAGLPGDLAIARPLPPSIEVVLQGKGWQLLLLSMSRRLAFDLPGARLRTDRILVTSRYLPEAMKLPPGVVAVQTFPDTLAITVDQYLQKKVPIRPVFDALTFKEDYGLSHAVAAIPDSVVLMGAERILRGLQSWPTEALDLRDLSASATEEAVLADSLPELVRFRREPVKIFVPVEQLADMQFDAVPVSVISAPRDRQVLLAKPSITVYLRGGVDKLAAMSIGDIGASIDYRVLVSDTTGSVVPIVRLPEGVTLLKIDPQSIRYTIRQ